MTHANRGGQYFRRGDVELAIADYNTAIRLNPKNRNAYTGRGAIYRSRGEETKALADFDKAISIPVENDKPWDFISRARALRRKGELTAALSDLDNANRLDPKIREVYVERAELYNARNNYQRAYENFDAALELNTNDAQLLAGRARMAAVHRQGRRRGPGLRRGQHARALQVRAGRARRRDCRVLPLHNGPPQCGRRVFEPGIDSHGQRGPARRGRGFSQGSAVQHLEAAQRRSSCTSRARASARMRGPRPPRRRSASIRGGGRDPRSGRCSARYPSPT